MWASVRFANGAVSGAIQGAMMGSSRRSANQEGAGAGSEPLPKDQAIATMKRGVSIFAQMRADGRMDGMSLYDDIDAVNRAHPGAFKFRYDGERTYYSDGREVIASADVFEYSGISVHQIDSLDGAMETIFHEVAHLDPEMARAWRQSTPGIGSLNQYPDIGIQQRVHSQIDASVNRLMEVYRESYRP